MCGISGWVSYTRDLTTSRALVDAMGRTLDCRGPDDSGSWVRGPAGLAHTRLAVIDLEGGRQPMLADLDDDTVVLTYSGEVYNYREVRDQLRRRGHTFTTRSDTEVVLRGFLEWGAGVATRLNGMFAFAVWDTRPRELTLVRDRLGIKPLYYRPTGDGVLFASEPKAILAHPLGEPVVDVEGLHRMLAYAVTVPGVIWRGMHEVPPGSTVVVRPSGTSTHGYWDLGEAVADAGPRPRLRTAVGVVGDLLDDTIQRQLVADVPRSVLLSGGLDSGALTAIAAEGLGRGGERLQTYTVDFVGYDESFVSDAERADPDGPFVRDVVAHVDCDHRDLVLHAEELADPALRRAVVDAYDVPPGSGDRDRSLYLLFRSIREHSLVTLSGEGADELFAGYHWCHDPTVLRGAGFPWITALFDSYGLPREALAPDVAPMVDLERHLADEFAKAAAAVELRDDESESERAVRVMSHLSMTRHLRVLLDRKDRLSMALGLEVRVPYCDHRLVEYVYALPWSLKSFDGREKSLLRRAVADRLPASVRARAKSAFPSLRDHRYLAALGGQASDLAADADHAVFELIDRSWLYRAARRPPAGLDPVRHTLEWVLNLAVWLELRRPVLKLT